MKKKTPEDVEFAPPSPDYGLCTIKLGFASADGKLRNTSEEELSPEAVPALMGAVAVLRKYFPITLSIKY